VCCVSRTYKHAMWALRAFNCMCACTLIMPRLHFAAASSALQSARETLPTPPKGPFLAAARASSGQFAAQHATMASPAPLLHPVAAVARGPAPAAHASQMGMVSMPDYDCIPCQATDILLAQVAHPASLMSMTCLVFRSDRCR
jgi:hypothetical protein